MSSRKRNLSTSHEDELIPVSTSKKPRLSKSDPLVTIETKVDPSENTNNSTSNQYTYVPIAVSTMEILPRLSLEAVFNHEDDRRTPCDTTNISFYSRIGLLTATFQVAENKYRQPGTATVFYVNKESNKAYAITCAHNLIYYSSEGTTHKAENILFRRQTTQVHIDVNMPQLRDLSTTSTFNKGYKIDNNCIWTHPQYNPQSKTPDSYDLGIVSFEDFDEYFCSKNSELNVLPITESFAISSTINYVSNTTKRLVDNLVQEPQNFFVNLGSNLMAGIPFGDNQPVSYFSGLAIIGYPDEKQEQLWKEEEISENAVEVYRKECEDYKNGEMIKYKIHTTTGQSGSPIIVGKGDNGIKIIGIHTSRYSDSNYGVKLNEKNIEWIKKRLIMSENTVKNENDDIMICGVFRPEMLALFDHKWV
eukprot:7479_1